MAADLHDIAFGADPGAPVPPAHTPRERWLAGVALGGQGHYAAATALLAPLASTAGPVAALAGAALASHRRQLGGHAAARRLDGRALLLLGEDEQARSDVLLGLAADALGLGLTRQAHALLDRAAGLTGWRHELRHDWVTAEVLLAEGRAAQAVAPAERAAERALACDSVRHQVKADLVLAAALATASDPSQRPIGLLQSVVARAQDHGLAPLVWPSALLLAELDPDGAATHRMTGWAALHAVLHRTDPIGRRIAEASPWVPTRAMHSLEPPMAASGRTSSEELPPDRVKVRAPASDKGT
ncbi:hypothetical protein [Labedaea rhizosphaerae]|uniref:Tetratricopeptide repeat protein n=1 Tax=Labedaea rhizosphaerae TaxID=598644 RepID=A0A4V3D0I4_LABRH|nr:hypothetical protein [Labedaea rhizosphaerae]TDQ05815.1 hypothetical protein EV186_1011793 [Labedaea rhizosphaerae]